MDGPKTLKSEKLEQLQNGILTPFVTKSALTNSILESVKKMRKCNFALWVNIFHFKKVLEHSAILQKYVNTLGSIPNVDQVDYGDQQFHWLVNVGNY